MKALIIVDIQNDFLPEGNLPVNEGDTIIPLVNELQKNYDLVVATQDWHPSNHQSFASQHEGKKPYDSIELLGLDQTLWTDHCVQGTFGAEFPKELNQNLIETIFRKGTETQIDSYSGFFDNGKLKSTGLADYLRGKQITEIDVCGLAADFCVYFTAKDAVVQGFKTRILEQATKPIFADNFEKIKEEFVKMGGEIA
ncbi:MAG: bifunctional nicotinamidase/pyrazinamidase [Flavobacteriaceae bacterium]|jgi:nicotinamidase/pyrazinamidase|nr:bifunctional nicotinamidase/pyrazinamidase [Flavobacteriaceae bacterium]